MWTCYSDVYIYIYILCLKEYGGPVIESEWIMLEYQMSWKKTSAKTKGKMGTEHQEGLLIAAKCKRMKETSRGQGYLEANY